MRQLVIDDLPPLIAVGTTNENSDSKRSTSEEELIRVLGAEWQKRELKCVTTAESWEERIRVSCFLIYF